MATTLKNTFASEFLLKLYLNPDFADVHFEFIVENQSVKLPAHKNILSESSSVFREMIKEKDVIEVVDAHVDVFKVFLQLIYSPKVNLAMETIEGVVKLALKYKMLDRLNSCVDFFESELTSQNMIWGYQLAMSLNNEKLIKFCEGEIQFLSSEHFKSDIFLHCDRAVLKNILELDVLYRVSAAELFEACIKWAKLSCEANGLNEADSKNLKRQLGDCFYSMRFAWMTPKEVATIIANDLYHGLFERKEMRELCHLLDEGFKSRLFQNRREIPRWDDWDVLTCNREKIDGAQYILQDKESTWFSTNEALLLRGITLVGFCISRSVGSWTDAKFDMKIVEYGNQTFEMPNVHKIYYSGTVSSRGQDGARVSFEQPIFIDPKQLYEIRLKPFSPRELRYDCDLSSKVKLDEKLTVKFHVGPSDGNRRSGLVRSLEFKRPKNNCTNHQKRLQWHL